MVYKGLVFFGALALIVFILFAITNPKNKIVLYILSFPFVFLGYAWSDFFAYELTNAEIGFAHSIGLGLINPVLELLQANIIDTWTLMIYLFLFVVLESYFFYTGYKISQILIPEIEEEILKGHKRKMRYVLSFGIVYPLQFIVIVILGSIWASLHFPDVIIVHIFLSLLFSVPISLYCVQKCDSMFPLLIAWFCWDVLIMFVV